MFGECAAVAVGLAGATNATAMPDERVPHERPLFSGDDLHQIPFDLDRVLVVLAGPAQREARGQAADVRVHHHTLVLSERGSQYDVGRLARHSWECEQIIHTIRHTPFERFQLYNLANDPLETKDVAGKNRKVFNELSAAVRLHFQRGGSVPWQKPAN